MSKKGARQAAMYNRPTKGWQNNQMKKQMADAGYSKVPKGLDGKKLKRNIIICAIVWAVLTILLIVWKHWWGLLIGIVIGAAATGGLIYFMRSKEREIIRYYKKMGVPKNEYFKQLARTSKEPMDAKTVAKMKKTWDKVD